MESILLKFIRWIPEYLFLWFDFLSLLVEVLVDDGGDKTLPEMLLALRFISESTLLEMVLE